MHGWDLTPREAVQLQKTLSSRVRTDLDPGQVSRMAGVDVSYNPATGESVASAVVLSFPRLQLLECSLARMATAFPYVPGLLSFREVPAILKAFEGLRRKPDLVLVDGHGRAHPRRFGIACHLGLWLKIPTIGVGKSRLCGRYREPGARRGASTRLLEGDEVIGCVLRTRAAVKPVFVSVGFGLPLEECRRWVLRAAPRYRLPEPIRLADRLSRQGR